jgi:hypothetical protein
MFIMKVLHSKTWQFEVFITHVIDFTFTEGERLTWQ